MDGASSDDFAWPGTFALERDEANDRSTVTWRGTATMRFTWGSFAHREQLVYSVDDAHPEASSVTGESDTVETLPDHVLTWQGRLKVRSDATTFFYDYKRTLLRDGQMVRTRSWQESIPRDLQ